MLDTLYGVIVKNAVSTPVPDSAAMAPQPQLVGQVLLVEDNDINQLVAVELLSAFGVTVKVADDSRVRVRIAFSLHNAHCRFMALAGRLRGY